MGRNMSIAISAKDNFTQAITTMRNANSSFNKDLTGTSQKLDTLNKNKITLKVDTDKARLALKDAEKQFSATGSAADKMVMELSSANYDNAKRNLDLVSKNAKQAEKDILNMTDAVSKADNRAGSGKSSSTGMLGTLAQAGLTKMIGDTVSNVAQIAVSSAFGSESGTMFGSTLSGAAAGAAMGSLAGPVGTAVGAVVGGVTGAVNGAAEVFKSHDDALKSVVQDSYTNVKQSQTDALSRGTITAGNREQKQISFATLLGGDDDAKDYLSKMTDFAGKTPFQYDQLATMSKTMLAYGYKVGELIPELTKIGDTGSALSMSGDDMNFVATGLGRMRATGKTTMEYLNPLLERGIPVWEYLSEASGKTNAQVQEMVSKGLVPGSEAAKAISDYMGKDFAGNMEKQSKTYQGLQSSLEDAQDGMNAAMGNGYNETRKSGIKAQIDYLEGNSGIKMKDAYSMIGKYKASLDNTHEKDIRDAMDQMMETNDYKKAAAQNNQVEMGKLLAKAQIDGENAYKASQGYQDQLESDKSLVTSIRESMVKDGVYKTYGYDMGIEFSKGFAEVVFEEQKKLASKEQEDIKNGLSPNKALTIGAGGSYVTGAGGGGGRDPKTGAPRKPISEHVSGNATGIFRVPYNDYPTLLHEGETVNTAVEARSQKSTPTVTITGNSFVVREDADIDKIARAIVEKLSKASAVS